MDEDIKMERIKRMWFQMQCSHCNPLINQISAIGAIKDTLEVPGHPREKRGRNQGFIQSCQMK